MLGADLARNRINKHTKAKQTKFREVGKLAVQVLQKILLSEKVAVSNQTKACTVLLGDVPVKALITLLTSFAVADDIQVIWNRDIYC